MTQKILKNLFFEEAHKFYLYLSLHTCAIDLAVAQVIQKSKQRLKIPGRNLVLAKVYVSSLETPVLARPLASDAAVVVAVDQDEVGAGAPEKKS